MKRRLSLSSLLYNCGVIGELCSIRIATEDHGFVHYRCECLEIMSSADRYAKEKKKGKCDAWKPISSDPIPSLSPLASPTLPDT